MSESPARAGLRDFLLAGRDPPGEYRLPLLDAALAARLLSRIDAAPLHAHAYSLHLNLRFGGCDPTGVLEFASRQGLTGVRIHVDDGEQRSLAAMDDAMLGGFGERARELGLALSIETSATTRPHLELATRIARQVGARSVRCYPRHAGRVSEIIARTVEDLKQLTRLDPDATLHYTLEQHEDLKSGELVRIIAAVDNPRLSLLFDFGNMVNAWEMPDDALTTMAPHVTEVHVKDVTIVDDRGGHAHLGCRSGTGDINMPLMMFRLLLLGEDRPQVRSFGLEEEVGYPAPAFRFPDEDDDPFIPYRDSSETPLDDAEGLPARLARERADAEHQTGFVKELLERMRTHCVALVDQA